MEAMRVRRGTPRDKRVWGRPARNQSGLYNGWGMGLPCGTC